MVFAAVYDNVVSLADGDADDDFLEQVNDIIGQIESGVLNKAIMKIISPKFAFNKKMNSEVNKSPAGKKMNSILF